MIPITEMPDISKKKERLVCQDVTLLTGRQCTCDPGIIDGHEARVTGHHNVTPRVAYDDQSDGFSSTVNQ